MNRRLLFIDVCICLTLSLLVFIAGSIWLASRTDPSPVQVQGTYSPPDIPTPTTLNDYLVCYHDDDTEPWVPNMPVPAPGECP